ncbi:helix-turn-helix domain-containing protein [Actinomycetota bacterium Odt1-20B]
MTGIGALVRARRRAASLSQAELAARSGTGQAAISRIESGRDTPTLQVLDRIATALGCTLTVSLDPEQPSPPPPPPSP